MIAGAYQAIGLIPQLVSAVHIGEILVLPSQLIVYVLRHYAPRRRIRTGALQREKEWERILNEYNEYQSIYCNIVNTVPVSPLSSMVIWRTAYCHSLSPDCYCERIPSSWQWLRDNSLVAICKALRISTIGSANWKYIHNIKRSSIYI